MEQLKRGLIIRPTVKGPDVVVGLDSVLLRKLILYWDILDYPIITGSFHDDRSIHNYSFFPNYSLFSEMKILKDEGIITESRVANDKGLSVIKKSEDFKQVVFDTQIALLKLKNKEKNTLWAIADLNDDISKMIFTDEGVETNYIEFVNFLPVPAEGVTIEKILSFKNKRRDELLGLRITIDELTTKVCKSENPTSELKKQKEMIEKNVLDLHKLMDEGRIEKILSSVKTFLASDKTVNTIPLAIDLFCGNIPGATKDVLALLKIGSGKTKKIDNIPDNSKNYLYAYNVENELNKL